MSNPAQPSLAQAYTTAGNPADTSSAEQAAAQRTQSANSNAQTEEQRVPTTQSESTSEATPTSLAQGIHGGARVDSAATAREGRAAELDAAQVGAPGEGVISDAVNKKAGATGSAPDLAEGLDKKKAEQEAAREDVKAQRGGGGSDGVDVQAVLDSRSS